MKIGIICYPTLGGSGAIAANLGLNLACLGHDIHFISYGIPFRLEGYHERVRYHAVEVSSYPLFKYPPYDMALACKIMEVQEKEDLDILHVHYAIPHAISAYLARQMLPDHPVKVVTTLHGTDITLVGNERSYFEATRFGIEQSHGVTSVSQYLRNATESIFKTKREIRVIPNFVNPDRLCPSNDPELRRRYARDDEKLIVHTSNFRPVKRVLDAVKIFAQIHERVPSRFLLLGDGPDLPKASNLAQELGIADQVVFLGQQSEVGRILSVSDLFLLPTDTESFGLAALEAMSCGVPVIATKTGGIPEVVSDEVDGFLCQVGDVDCMSQKGISLLLDPTKHRDFSARARLKATDQFNCRDITPLYEAYYEEVLAQPSAPATGPVSFIESECKSG